MSNNDFLEKIKGVNKDYKGQMKSLTFIVQRGKEEKKIFKWIFTPDNIDFYITFPYYQTKNYHCGTVEIPQSPIKDGVFNAVKNGLASQIPVKFSYHKDGNVHFKPTNYGAGTKNKGYKLAAIKVDPLSQANGSHLFTIRFEGLSKFKDLKKHRNSNGELETILLVPEDIINFEIQAFAGSSQKSIDGQIKKGAVPWFQIDGRTAEGKPIFIGVYAILSRKSHIVDGNKNALNVLVGFDRTQLNKTGNIKSLYLFAR
ncbi:MAG TPA: hypothetical protein VNW29_02005 [Candidatus Sulfotelmatobacter sp.]|jgi:hypothetical protein|nr:hypothetical protein [Candidatus Sulfotelmatobacter sp.]